MNVYDKSSLFSLSLAFMRRFAFVDVDLPEESIYKPLRDGWIDDQIPASADRQSLKDGMDRLLERDTALMRRRALGPAIIKDMLEYMGDRCGDNADETALLNLLTEAFMLYAAPQLDGLDRDGICRIHTRVSEIFGQAAEDLGLLGRIKDLYPYIPDEDWIVCDSDRPEAPEAEGGQED
jgi:hypothetical protein